MTERRVTSLPFLPGNSFRNPSAQDFRWPQIHGMKNGYSQHKLKEIGIGGTYLHHNTISQDELDALANHQPTITYGKPKQAPPETFVPAFVAFDKKVLRFKGYFKQTVYESPNEHYRVRPVDVFYYLEDDSISVMEPEVRNSGMPQGKILHRQKIAKNDYGATWHWTDLNLGRNVTFYGRTFRIVDCDPWTRGFLESEGIQLDPPECIPEDPYTASREKREAVTTKKSKTDYDKLRQFLEMDKKILRFFAVWDDRDNLFGELRPVLIHYYLADDTVEVREVHRNNDGRDPFPVLINRHKILKDRSNIPATHPSVYMEITDKESKDYFTSSDFMIGKTVFIYGRRFLIYDVDNFTKSFYYQNFGVTDFTPIEVDEKGQPLPKMEIPPYNGYGSLEDSLQNVVNLIPEPAKKDYIKVMENDSTKLRYEAVMDSVHNEDAGRRFVLIYHVADDTMSIYETPTRNSGIIGGKFLEKSRIAKPGSIAERPNFYGPQDFYMGAVIEVFKTRFVIKNADAFVLSFAEKYQDQFPQEVLENLRAHLGNSQQDKTAGCYRYQPMTVVRNDGDTARLVGELRTQLKKLGIIGRPRIDEVFLQLDNSRRGYITKEDIKRKCQKINLPTDEDIMDATVREITQNPEGKISLEEWRKYLEE